jgi:endonuclease YncB( thermonuclease family)
MARLAVLLILFAASVFGRDGIIRDIIDERTVLIEYNGELKRAHLVGIASYLAANPENKTLSYKDREALRAAAIEYLREQLPPGEPVDFVKLDYDDDALHIYVIKKRDGTQLNYDLIKRGYALLDANDPYLLRSFYMRMKRAMEYAKERQNGLWRQQGEQMAQLVQKRDFYGSQNKNIPREDILEYLRRLSIAPAL